jgi:hypothetical protein
MLLKKQLNFVSYNFSIKNYLLLSFKIILYNNFITNSIIQNNYFFYHIINSNNNYYFIKKNYNLKQKQLFLKLKFIAQNSNIYLQKNNNFFIFYKIELKQQIQLFTFFIWNKLNIKIQKLK